MQPCPVPETTNVALNKPSSQSSNFENNNAYGASKAVDGEIGTEVGLGRGKGTTVTHHQLGPWWKVDLEAQHYISQVVVYNRQYVESGRLRVEKRLQGFRVEIFNGDDTNAVWTYDDPTPDGASPGPEILINIPMCVLGDQVKISIPGKTRFLQMREVEVFASSSSSNDCPNMMANVALNKPSSQSSNYDSNNAYGASKAVDGVTKSESELGNTGGITTTKNELSPWWEVDLDGEYFISHILIYNRLLGTDGEFVSVLAWLQGFRVELFDGDNPTAVWTYDDPTSNGSNPGTSIRINVPICVVATRVKVSLPGKTMYLNMREVEVYGERV